MKTYILLLLFSLFALLNSHLDSQELINPMFNQLNYEDLGVQKISGVRWDNDSKMWFLSEKGLSNYNGNSVKHFSADSTNSNSILTNNIISLKVTKQNQLWMTYIDTNAITRYDIDDNKFYHIQDQKLLPRGINVKVVPVNEDEVIVCSWGGGFSMINLKTNTSQHFKRSSSENSQERIKDIVILEEDRWLVTYFESGSFKSKPFFFNPIDKSFTELPLSRYVQNLSDEFKEVIKRNLEVVNFAHVDRFNNYWFGTYSGLIHLNNEDSTASRIVVDSAEVFRRNVVNARDYTVDNNGLLWVSTYNSGVLLVDPKTKKAKYIKHDPENYNSIASNATSSILNDNLGNTWVSTGPTNFSVYNPYLQNFQIKLWKELPLRYTNQSAQNIPVNQMYTSDDGIIYISSGEGLLSYDYRSDNYETIISNIDIPNFKNASIPGIENFKIHKQRVYHSGEMGVNVYDLNKERYLEPIYNQKLAPLFTHQNSSTDTIYFFRSNRHGTKIFQYAADESMKEVKVFPKLRVLSLGSCVLPNGKWLLNTKDDGFFIVDPKLWSKVGFGGEKRSNDFNPLSINCTQLINDHLIWVGTNEGLFKLNFIDGSISLANDDIGVKNEQVRSMRYDQDSVLWIALRDKLYKWDKGKGKGFYYSRSMGLKSGDFMPSFGQISDNGKIFFVARNGILSFKPKSLIFPEHDFRLYFDDLRINDKHFSVFGFDSIQGRERLSLSWDQTRLVFEFGNNQYFSPNPHRFYYRIKGLSDEWQSNGASNVIKIFGLAHGKYTLEVKAINSYHQESNIESIRFEISRPLWLNPWFYILVVVLILVATFVIVKAREKKIIRQKEKLEQTVEERTVEVTQKAEMIQKQKDVIELKNLELMDSITYAKRIQDAILPSYARMNYLLSQAFVYYRPKEIVAGDFYWVQPDKKDENSVFFAVADCTGHGVPGAIVSVICNNALHRALRESENTSPNQILNTSRKLVIEEFEKSHQEVKDGMDIALCKLHKNTRDKFNLEFAGANNPLIVIREKSEISNYLVLQDENLVEVKLEPNKVSEEHLLFEVKGDKQPVGRHINNKPFTNHKVQLEKGDVIYLFSDGFHDQFGSFEKIGNGLGKKLKSGNFKKMLLSGQSLKFKKQVEFLDTEFTEWKGSLEQIDDVCVLGFKFNG